MLCFCAFCRQQLLLHEPKALLAAKLLFFGIVRSLELVSTMPLQCSLSLEVEVGCHGEGDLLPEAQLLAQGSILQAFENLDRVQDFVQGIAFCTALLGWLLGCCAKHIQALHLNSCFGSTVK